MLLIALILFGFSNENDLNFKESATSQFQSEYNNFNFFKMIYQKFLYISRVYYENITQPLTIKSIFSRRLEVPLNNSKTNFKFLQKMVEKIYYNKTFIHKYTKNTTDLNTNSTFYHHHPNIQKVEITNPYSLLFLVLLIQLCNVFDLLSNLPFRNLSQLKRYIQHLPPGTLKLYRIMIYIHLFSIFMLFVDSEFLVELFGQSTSLVFGDFQFWRIITSTLLHADLIHLFSNMFEFILCGPYFEKKVGTDFFYFHIYWISIFISIVEAILHCGMYLLGFTERISTLSLGFSGVIFALYILAGQVARQKKRERSRRRSTRSRSRRIYTGNNSYWPIYVSSSRSSSPSLSPSNLYLIGTNITYCDFFSNELVPWYLLIITFILSPTSSFTAHFAGIIVGEIYIHYLEPNDLLVRNISTVRKFNSYFPWAVFGYFIFYCIFLL